MNRLDILKNLAVRGYVAPTVEVCFVKAEAGFFVSQNDALNYGEAGAAGTIGNGSEYEL